MAPNTDCSAWISWGCVREYIEPGDFFKYSHRLIFKAMIDLADRGDAIDATTVRNILDSQGDLQNIGGLSYLVEVIKDRKSVV